MKRMSPIVHALLTSCAALACSVAPAMAAAPVSTAFTYQGALDRAGMHVAEGCQFQFKLFDAPVGLGQIGPTLTPTITVYETGNFSAELDFGTGAFTGNARWLEIAVQCPGDASFTTLAPRQSLTAAPYALYALSAPSGGGGLTLPFTGVANSPSQTAFEVDNTASTGLFHGILGVTYSTTQNASGLQGEGRASSGFTSGVQGYAVNSPNGTGVVGHGQGRGGWFQSLGTGSYGVEGVGIARGVVGSGADGVYGNGTNAGLYGDGNAYGVVGNSVNGFGVYGTYGLGLFPPSGANAGVYGTSASTNAGSAGVRGDAGSGYGVQGTSASGVGIYGTGQTIGTKGSSPAGDGVWGESNAAFKGGVVGFTSSAQGWGGYFRNLAGGLALVADGMAQVKTLQILGADLAERFPVRGDRVEPGTVMVLDGTADGRLRVSDEPYSRRVAGVVSGANGLDAGVVLHGTGFDTRGEAPVALSGRVWVKCDATSDPIHPGDLLTTSSRPGHAMRARDRDRAFGAIVGKAMTSLEAGTGLVLVLVSLQ